MIDFGGHKLVNGEDVGHFDVKGRLGLGVKVIKFVNVEVGFCVLDRDHCMVSVGSKDKRGKHNTYSGPRFGPAAGSTLQYSC